MGLLHAPLAWGGLASSLGGQLLARSLISGGFAGSLLGTGHVIVIAMTIISAKINGVVCSWTENEVL